MKPGDGLASCHSLFVRFVPLCGYSSCLDRAALLPAPACGERRGPRPQTTYSGARSMPSSVCRWGILGTANIARKNWKAIRLAGNSTLTAVAIRSPDRARTFIAEGQGEVPLPAAPPSGADEDLLRRDDVDAVYVPLPTGIRRGWVVRAAQAGKHILCEKPCGTTAADVRAMLDACRANRVQFMDGVMFMHS